MKSIITIVLLSVATAASAAPATHKKAGPDRNGVTTFWVKCENGNVSTTQCFKDVSHCGAASDQSLGTAAVLACDAIVGLIAEPRK